MANIVKGNGPTPAELDPFRMLRDWLRWDPFRAIEPASARAPASYMPSFEVRETDDAYLFRADLPGVAPADLDVSLTGSRLTISGKRDEEKEIKEETIYVYERAFGTFTRTFTLPEGIDAEHIKSELTNGVLTVVIPKTAATKPKKIEVAAPPPATKS